MSQEIIEAVREIERDKGIEEGALVAALEDALLAAYKKTPGASRHATVEMDDAGDFRVFSIELPPDVEERLLEVLHEDALAGRVAEAHRWVPIAMRRQGREHELVLRVAAGQDVRRKLRLDHRQRTASRRQPKPH